MTSPHPVRLVVTDDLRRSRLTVLLRLLLAIPHFVWATVWSIAAYLVAIVNWFATLIAGRSPKGPHGFLAAYLRYTTHLLAYLTLAANPYPPFTGNASYPVDLEIDDPQPQRRLVTLFRLFLAVPAILLAVAFLASFAGGGEGYSTSDGEASASFQSTTLGILWTVAFFAWFASLVMGRMPLGFRNLQAYGIRYVAQVSAYMFLLTDRYPNVDPADPPSTGPLHPVGLRVEDDLRRSRLTVFFRLLLSLVHFVWLVLWGIVAFLAVIASWFATLVMGRTPSALHRFIAAYVRYSYHVFAFLFLTANPFPGFTGAAGRYPVDPELPPPERQRRLVTGFRLFLAFPALLVSSAVDLLLVIAAFLGWFAALVLGRMPRSLRDAQAYALRYGVQTSAYLALLTDRYPFSGPALGEPEPPAEPAETPVAV